MINRVVLTGRLTRNPELKTTQSEISVASFTIAVNKQFTDANGNRGADFINCVIWRKAAENLCKFTHKGSLIGVDGRLQTRSYDNNGQKVFVTEVVVDSFSLLESKNENQSSNNNGYSNNSSANTAAEPDPFAGGGDTVDISDDDLPF